MMAVTSAAGTPCPVTSPMITVVVFSLGLTTKPYQSPPVSEEVDTNEASSIAGLSGGSAGKSISCTTAAISSSWRIRRSLSASLWWSSCTRACMALKLLAISPISSA